MFRVAFFMLLFLYISQRSHNFLCTKSKLFVVTIPVTVDYKQRYLCFIITFSERTQQ